MGFGLAVAMLAQAPTPTPRDTQLIVALPSELGAADPELLVRHALYGQRYFERRFGRRATTAWSRDTLPASPPLQQILSEAGFTQLLTDTPATDSARVPVVYRFGDEPREGAVEQVQLAEMLAAIDTSPSPSLEGAWRFDSFAYTVRPLRDQAFARLAADLDTRGSGVPIVVFNPTSSVRSSQVTVPLDSALRALGRGARNVRAVDAARRATVAARDGDSLRVFAREVPAYGLKAFWIRTGQGATGDGDTTTAPGTRLPLLALRVATQAGLAGPSWSFVSLDADNVRVTAVKRAERTRAVVLRVVEWRGQAARVMLRFGRRLARVRVANLLEDPLRTLALAPDGHSATVALRPWEIVTLLVEEAR